MKVAVICEFSGIVRDAFKELGHDATSFDLLPSERPGKHIQGDIFDLSYEYWSQYDLAICHPPCTHLAVSGARWFINKENDINAAIEVVRKLMLLPVKKIAIENPISIISTKIFKPSQIIQPWMFGHGETKATCLWLKGLPLLKPTNIVPGRINRIHSMAPSKDRWKERSRTYPGIAQAMAAQWTNIEEEQLCLNF